MSITIEQIAEVAHEVNRAYCTAIGDATQLPWSEALDWQKESAVSGVNFRITNPTISAEEMHQEWSRHKIEGGWKYGPIKDDAKKEHPCLVPYADLPLEQRVKDYLFNAVVTTLSLKEPTK